MSAVGKVPHFSPLLFLLLRTFIGLVKINTALLSLVHTNLVHYTCMSTSHWWHCAVFTYDCRALLWDFAHGANEDVLLHVIIISSISDEFVLRVFLSFRFEKIFCLVFCSGYLPTLVLINLLLMTGDCWIETSNMFNYMAGLKMKVSEYFRGG